jgi:hypothetical protein
MRTRKEVVVGLDLSLRSAAAVALNPSWVPGTWNIPTSVVGYGIKAATPEQRSARLVEIADALIVFAKRERATHVFVEDYAYGLAGLGGMMLAELGGAVKFLFYKQLGLVVTPVNVSTARKYFLGKLPPKDRAAITHRTMLELGCPFKTSDERDALLIASYGRTEVGLPGLACPC